MTTCHPRDRDAFLENVMDGETKKIGYWYWELSNVPDAFRSHFELVDEVWVPTTFVADAYRPYSSTPVVLVPPSVLVSPATGISATTSAFRSIDFCF